MSAGFEHGRAHWHYRFTAIRIDDTNHLTPPCRQSPHCAGDQYESDTGRKSSQDGVVDAFQEDTLHGIRCTHEVHPQIEPAFLLAQPGCLPPHLGETQQCQDRHEEGNAKQQRDDAGIPRLEAEPEVQPHATVHPGNGQENCLFSAEVGAELPIGQDQARVRVRGVEPGMRESGPNDMRHEERRDAQPEKELECFPGWQAEVTTLIE